MTAARPRRRNRKQDRCVKLTSALRLNACAQLQQELMTRIDMPNASPIELDGSDVDSTDAAALQLLVVFARECERRDIAWSWSNTSDALRQGSTLLGLDSFLAMPASPANT